MKWSREQGTTQPPGWLSTGIVLVLGYRLSVVGGRLAAVSQPEGGMAEGAGVGAGREGLFAGAAAEQAVQGVDQVEEGLGVAVGDGDYGTVVFVVVRGVLGAAAVAAIGVGHVLPPPNPPLSLLLRANDRTDVLAVSMGAWGYECRVPAPPCRAATRDV